MSFADEYGCRPCEEYGLPDDDDGEELDGEVLDMSVPFIVYAYSVRNPLNSY